MSDNKPKKEPKEPKEPKENDKTQKKGQPWQPKEKFDKKANKEKLQQEKQQQQQQQPSEQKQEPQDAAQPVQQVQPAQPQTVPKKPDSKPEVKTLEVQPTNRGFVSHLKVYQQHSSRSIRQLEGDHMNVLHPTLIQICISYQNGQCMGSTYRCCEFLRGLKVFIQDFNSPKHQNSFAQSLNEQIPRVYQLVEEFRSVNEAMKTSYKFIRYLLSLLFKFQGKEQEQKLWLCQQIDQFINQKINTASQLIVQNACQLVRQNNKVLVYARSYLVENFLIDQHKKGKELEVYVVDNPPFHEGKKLFEVLTEQGLECTLLNLSHVSYLIKKVDKIFVGAHSMLSNGALLSRVGTALVENIIYQQLACLANTHRVPFHVFCETYKFSEQCQIDSLSWNELTLSENNTLPYKPVGLMYDVTPSQQIDMVITEIGLMPSTSVKAVIREFKKYNYVDKVELPKLTEEP